MDKPERIDLQTPVQELDGLEMVVSAGKPSSHVEVLVLGFRRNWRGRLVARSSHVGSSDTRTTRVDPAHSLERVASELLGDTATRALRSPPVTWGVSTLRHMWRWARWLVPLTTISWIISAMIDPVSLVSAILGIVFLLILSGMATWLRGRKTIRTEIPGTRRATSWPMTWLLERTPDAATATLVLGEVPAPANLAEARSRIDTIKAEYGRLLSDIAYRIEHPALFDSAVAHTREFTMALTTWDDLSPHVAPDRAVDLAREAQVAFDAARAHAERVGMGHLPPPARTDARRALKAVRLAQGAATEAERVTALQQANRILSSLALYYLPDEADTTLALGGQAALEA